VAAYQQADAVIAISHHAASDGVSELGLEPDRVHVVPLAIDPRFVPAPAPVDPSTDPYLLLVGQYDARKGFVEAFDVIGRLADRGFPHVLKVAGNLPRWVRPEVETLREDAPHPERIALLGFVDDIRPLYWGAAATIITSRFEGFGLPALEAMASGCPVVAFDNSSLPEVIAGGGALVPDGDLHAFVDTTAALLTDAQARAHSVEAGLRRAAHFSEAAFVDGHVSVYERVIAEARTSRT
jgi:glycosyltransferase involved in cell wall biosynthesis